jgi:type VI protein secretion system component VasF
MEFIDGFHLNDLATHSPEATWQNICDEAVRIVNGISDRGIQNEDVRTASFIVCKDSVTGILLGEIQTFE